MWEVDGAQAPVRTCPHPNPYMTSFDRYTQLYCQNLSLFGKLFIDHKVSLLHPPCSIHDLWKSRSHLLVCLFPRTSTELVVCA